MLFPTCWKSPCPWSGRKQSSWTKTQEREKKQLRGWGGDPRRVRMEWGNGAPGGVVNSTWSSPGGVVSSTWSSPGAFSSTWSSPGAVLSSTGSHLDGGFWRVQRLCFLRNNENVTTKSADLYSDYQLSKKPPRASKSLCRCQTSMSGCTNPTEGWPKRAGGEMWTSHWPWQLDGQHQRHPLGHNCSV